MHSFLAHETFIKNIILGHNYRLINNKKKRNTQTGFPKNC